MYAAWSGANYAQIRDWTETIFPDNLYGGRPGREIVCEAVPHLLDPKFTCKFTEALGLTGASPFKTIEVIYEHAQHYWKLHRCVSKSWYPTNSIAQACALPIVA
eukprot:5112839-Karenia_brevis.AAC.1